MTPHWIRQLSPKAILAGGIVDLVATNVLVLPVAIPLFTNANLAKATTAEITAAFIARLNENPTLYLATILLGSIASVVAGWVAARIAKRAEILNGGCSTLLCVGISIYGSIRSPGLIPIWQSVAFAVLAPALGALGGVIRLRQLAARPQQPQALDASMAASPPGRGAGMGALLVASRVLLGVSLLLALVFGLTAAFGRQKELVFGSMILLVFFAFAATLYLLGGRALVAGRRSHWLLHVGATAILLAPLGLMAYGAPQSATARASSDWKPARPGEIFRFTAVGLAEPLDSIVLGETWLTADKYGAHAGDTLTSLPAGTFGGAHAIRVRRDATGVVTEIQFDYGTSHDIASLVDSYLEDLGEPADVVSDTSGGANHRITTWRSTGTEFRIVEFDPPQRSGIAASAYLTDLGKFAIRQ